MDEQSRIIELKGIGDKTEKIFQKLSVYTVGDLLRYFPRNYDIYEEPVCLGELEENKVMTTIGTISGRPQLTGNRNMQVTTIYLKDLTGSLKVLWFRMPFLKNTLKIGQTIILRGRTMNRRGQLVMEHPEIFSPIIAYEQKLNTLQPVYPLTTGITNNTITKAVKQCMNYLDLKQDFLPTYICQQYGLVEYNVAIQGIHFPQNKEEFYIARERLVFEEFLIFVLALRQLKEAGEKKSNIFQLKQQSQVETFIKKLPYKLTTAQKKVWSEMQHDMFGIHTMSRLIQGDVGSGKTIISLLGLLLVGLNGYQGAMMAPTEVLAKQHFESFQKMLKQYHIDLNVELLTGSMTVKEKRIVYERIETGSVHIIVGTHALIQKKVKFNNLALVVTDEQHRFGVKQRESLANKGNTPHILVMSATPIPRTLAIIIYGDLDISVIDELPANRLTIKNCVVDTNYRKTAYEFMKKEVTQGRQCYVVCPMVEESEHLEAENVIDYSNMLKEEFGTDIVIGYLHGKMKQSEKDIIMEHFVNNDIQILVSTTVIEVGINVPNATVMMVENAERFGLAQLHQLRGRVGRGSHQSYCIFMSSSKGKETKERLEILNQSNDGFFIASEDLKLRGPGDLFGIRQSGLLDFQLGDVFQDAKLLQKASDAANRIIAEDSELELEKHYYLKNHLHDYIEKSRLMTTL